MRWFGRRPRSRFPVDMVRRLELLGRYKMDQHGSGLATEEIIKDCVAPFYDDAVGDTDEFLTDLRAVVAGDTGGFATYGASCLVIELLWPDRRPPNALALVDAGLDFLHRRGLPSACLTGYEWERWVEAHGPDRW